MTPENLAAIRDVLAQARDPQYHVSPSVWRARYACDVGELLEWLDSLTGPSMTRDDFERELREYREAPFRRYREKAGPDAGEGRE